MSFSTWTQQTIPQNVPKPLLKMYYYHLQTCSMTCFAFIPLAGCRIDDRQCGRPCLGCL